MNIELVSGTDLASALDIVTNGLNAENAIEKGGDGSFWAVPIKQIDDARLFAIANPTLSEQCALVKITIPSRILNNLLSINLLEIIPEGEFFRFLPESFETLNEVASFEIIYSFIANEY